MFLVLLLPTIVYEGTWPRNTPSHIIICAQTHLVHMHQIQYTYTCPGMGPVIMHWFGKHPI